MSLYDLTGNKVSFTYGRLVQIASGSYYDGFGNPLNLSGSGTTLVTGSTYPITSSWSENTISASYALTASYALNGGGGGTDLVTGSTYPITSSWANNVVSASYSITSSYSSYSNTSSYSSTSISSSYALTASYVPNQFNLITGSTYPITSSWANNSISSSYSLTSSYSDTSISSSYSLTASYWSGSVISSSYSNTSSYSSNSTSASYSLTASYALNGGTTLVTGSTYPITSSWSNNTISASYSLTSSYSVTSSYSNNSNSSSYALSASYAPTNTNITASWSINSVTSSYIVTAQTASYYGGSVISSSYALTASYALNGFSLTTGSTYPITSSWANNTISASYSLTSSYSNNSKSSSYSLTASYWSGSIISSSYALTSSYAVTASYALNSLSASYCINPFPISGSLGYWGSFWDTTTQTNVSASNAMRLNNTDSNSNGVRVVSGSKITFDHDGVYNIQFSAVFDKSNANSDDVNVWLVKNGSTIPDTNTVLTIAGQAKTVAAWNFVTKLVTGDNVELYWQSAEANIKIYYQTTQSALIPATPSLIVTATQVTNTQIAPSASYALTASYALNGGGGGTSLTTGSTYPITSSWAITASYCLNSLNTSAAVSASFYSSSVWEFTHNLNASPVLVQAYDINFNQIIPQNILLLNNNVSRITFPISASGYAIASTSGLQTINSSGGTNLTTGSTYPITSSWSNNSLTASYLTPTNNYTVSDLTSSNLLVTGTLYASTFSSSTIYITSSEFIVTDNIITLNALNPYKRYAGLELHDSGSNSFSSILWDSQNNYLFVSSSETVGSRQIILGPNDEVNLISNYVPLINGSNTITSSIIYQNNSNIGIGTTSPSAKVDVVGDVQANAFYGKSFNLTTTSGQSAIFDTFTSTGTGEVYEVVIKGNPNAGESSNYQDIIYGKIIVGTGKTGSVATTFINYVQESPDPRLLYSSGGSSLTASVYFNSASVDVTQKVVGHNALIRVVVGSYAVGYVGNNTTVRLKQIL